MIRWVSDMAAPVRKVGRKLGFWRGGIILMYHRVAEGVSDPWSLCVSPARFDEQLQALGQWAELVSLSELADPVAARRRAITVTFDDGYADNFHAALPALKRHGVPATFFISTGPVLSQREYWWDALEQLVLCGEVLPDRLILPGGGHAIATADREALYHALWRRIGKMGPVEQQDAIDSLGRQIGRTATTRPSHRPMTAQEVAAFGREGEGLFTIGGHTCDHIRLPLLSPQEQARQIGENKRQLEEMTGRRIADFSYPYGDHDRCTVRAVRDAGFVRACTTGGGAIREGADAYRLPRIAAEDVDGEQLVRQVAELCP